MKKFVLAAAAVGTLLAAMAVGVAPTSAAGTVGYTIIDNGDETCDLATLDLTTGQLTDLPAASSPDACVNDLAANSEGAVWGIAGDTITPGAVPAAAAPSQIVVVEFSPDGTPNPSTIFFDDAITNSVLAFGGIAFDPALGAIIQVGVGGTDPACPTGAGVCLMTYDPETGLATAIGGSGMLSTPFAMLTSCSSGIYTMYDPDGIALATVDPDTGAVTDGPFVDDPIEGFDCAPGTGTLHAIAGGIPLLRGNGTAGFDSTVGTLDPETGNYTPTASVSDPDADIYLLAVPGASVPVPTTTTSTTIDVANANAVAPAFTG